MGLLRRRERFLGEVYRDTGNNWRWRAVGRNGEIVADSAEGYKNRAHAENMCRAVCRVRTVKPVER